MSARIVITGGAGFLGCLLARRLLASSISLGGGSAERVGELVLLDLVAPPPDLARTDVVRPVVGELVSTIGDLGDVDAVFHLAGAVSGAAEADFDLGMRTNVDGIRAVLEYTRRRRVPPVLVFSSSLAVFGSDPALGPIGPVDDDTLPRPQTSYGTQKFIGEQLVADYTRKGFVRGRAVRLATVSVRSGTPNAAVSGFLSGIIREPLAGQRAACPVPPDTPVALSSPRRSLAGIVLAAEADDDTWGSRTAMNLPALTTTPELMAAALDRIAGAGTSDLINWVDDPVIGAIVRSWPAEVRAARAQRLGLTPDSSFDDVVRAYLADNPAARGSPAVPPPGPQ
ncbi:D-erythronate dehydrogenase [Actinophytocola sp.]|uniref:D-erythronate dehydrogenase n=1 Tax=Actinophytocola sp. TaxID=1872138 RepID=UPI002D7E4573|nr:D-erythronate dehydrogenase [Actinophytocola sp.]HET9143621.1 D-erythronate dehydrogenase [Actinophytocola sp.]